MPQWQFKLFEYDIREELSTDRIERIPGHDYKRFIIQMYGIDENGKTACIFVKGFNPFFYVKVGDDWDESKVMEFVHFIRNEMGTYYGDSLVKAKLLKRQKLYGFDNKKLFNFVQLKFTSMQAFNKCKNLWYEPYNYGDNSEKKLLENGLVFSNTSTELYEAQIPPLLRLFHIQKIKPSGWIALKNGCYTENKKRLTSCDYEFTVNYKYLFPVNDEEKEKICVPLKILSLDIEASSSHGDFPLAKKNYLKLATNIVDYLIINNIDDCDSNLLRKLIKTGFGYETSSNIEKIYTKKTIELEDLDNLITELLKIKPGKKDNYIDINDNTDDEDNSDMDVDVNNVEEVYKYKKYKTTQLKDKDSEIIDIINSKTLNRNTRIIELTKCFGQHNPKQENRWEGIFPEVEGDRVTFIGSTIRKNGEIKPYLKHCIVVGDCNEIENSVVESYKTEKEALLAWTNFIQKEDPDIIIGYNIHGWDQGFMYDRSIELNCRNQFCKLSRQKNECCIKEIYQGATKPKRITIEESSIKIASGQFDLRYFKMSGRLQIDFLNVFRREEQLQSYKLDFVSSHFIGDIIKKLEYNSDNQTVLYSKNLTGLNKNDYIVIEEIAHSKDVYENGKKFKVSDIIDDKIILNEKIYPDKEKVLRWCLGKDDVTPQDIFKLTNEGPDGRAIVGKYCLKDCDLVHDLMRKNDTLTTYTEMSNLSWVPMNFLVFRGQGIKLTSYVGQKCREKNTLMPVIDKGKQDEGYEGAIVLPPKCNLYLKKPVACVDYSSLYPSSIISENISHDSKVWTKEYDLDGNLLEENGEKDSNGDYIYDNLPGLEYINITYDTFRWIRKTPKAAATKEKCGYKTCRFVQFENNEKAIMPSILQELLAARKATKRQMKNESDPFMANVLDKRQLAIKVTANSLYGQTGAKTSTFYDKDIAASTTATGRKLLIYAKELIERCYDNTVEKTDNYGEVKCYGEYIYGDSVASYTPIYVRYNKTVLDICSVEELAEKYGNGWYLESPKEYCELNNIESWTENGWTECHRVIRHRLAPYKKMVRILTHTGLVDVTDDHSLVKNTGEEISPKDVSIGTKLLHCTMRENNLNIESDISIDEARIMGFFFGDGSCGIYDCPSGRKASWALNNSNKELIEKYYNLCKSVYPEFEWKVYDTLNSSSVYKICFNKKSGSKTKILFIEKYRSMLYNKKSKIIPSEIINGSIEIRKSFWEGLYDADGDKDKNGYTRIDQKSQISAAYICWLANSIGYKTSLNIRDDKPEIYRITATKNKQRLDGDKIKKIVDIQNSEDKQDYVYDLTTENHHFAAGIGNMIVHNTDSVFFTFNLKELDETPIVGKKALEITIELAQRAGALATKFLKNPHDLEYEKTFMPFCLLSKKRYVGMLYELNPDKAYRKDMGIVLKRRDNAPIVKDIYGGVIDILMKEQVVYKAIDFVKQSLQDVIDGKFPQQKLIITKSLQSYYKNPMQIAHNVLAMRIAERDPGNKPKPGDRIPFVYIQNSNKKALQGEKIETPQFINENKIDIDYGFYITNQIMKPIQQVFALVLEDMSEFIEKRGLSMKSWKADIQKLHEKWPDKEKFDKKYEEFRCKEVKSILFDPYIKKLK
jgi:DNA polymerase elongation subunit (family B)